MVIVPSLVALLCRIYKTASFMCFVVMCLNSSRNFRDKEFTLLIKIKDVVKLQCPRRLTRVSVQGVKSLGGHFTCLCRGFEFYEVKKKIRQIGGHSSRFVLFCSF